MKIAKTITDRVIEANRNNAKKSTGPHNMTATSQNARKHGLLAKRTKFETDEERQEFETLVEELHDDWRPQGFTERTVVDDLAVSVWKLTQLSGWEGEEFANRRAASKAILELVSGEAYPERQLMFKKWDPTSAAAKLGWDCEELVLRTTDTQRESSESTSGSRAGIDNIHMEAKLRTRLETILRYQHTIRNNFYRAIKALQEFKRERDGAASEK